MELNEHDRRLLPKKAQPVRITCIQAYRIGGENKQTNRCRR